MTKPNLKQLRETALAATPGPWKVDTNTLCIREKRSDGKYERGIHLEHWMNEYNEDCGNFIVRNQRNNLKHITSCDPQTILALIDVIEMQNEALDSVEHKLIFFETLKNEPAYSEYASSCRKKVSETLAKVGELISFEEG